VTYELCKLMDVSYTIPQSKIYVRLSFSYV